MTPEVPPCGCRTPGSADPATCYCSVAGLLEIIRRCYSLALMAAVRARGVARYVELERAFPAASSSTLAETLHALEKARLLDKDVPRHGRRAAYRLTGSGERLLRRLRGLLADVLAST